MDQRYVILNLNKDPANFIVKFMSEVYDIGNKWDSYAINSNFWTKTITLSWKNNWFAVDRWALEREMCYDT